MAFAMMNELLCDMRLPADEILRVEASNSRGELQSSALLGFHPKGGVYDDLVY